jgi:hypothetical protein
LTGEAEVFSFFNGSYSPHRAPGLLFISVIIFFTQTVGRLGRVTRPSQVGYLYTGQHKHNKRIHRHPCLVVDSNPRSQRSSERRQFMPGGRDLSTLRKPAPVPLLPLLLPHGMTWARTRDLPACSIVPQPTPLPRTP